MAKEVEWGHPLNQRDGEVLGQDSHLQTATDGCSIKVC